MTNYGRVTAVTPGLQPGYTHYGRVTAVTAKIDFLHRKSKK